MNEGEKKFPTNSGREGGEGEKVINLPSQMFNSIF